MEKMALSICSIEVAHNYYSHFPMIRIFPRRWRNLRNFYPLAITVFRLSQSLYLRGEKSNSPIAFFQTGFLILHYSTHFSHATIPRRPVSIARGRVAARRSREVEIPFPRIWHRAGSKGSEAPAGPVLVLNRGRKKARGGLESWPRGGFRRGREPLLHRLRRQV